MIKRTSVNLDLELIAEARAVLGTSGLTDTIHGALREVVREVKVRRLLGRRFELDEDDGDWFRRPVNVEADATVGAR